MAYCLPIKDSEKFRKALMNGTLKPEDLINKTSKERHDIFASLLGEENAKDVNALFESKLLLKNQQKGLITWAESLLGLRPSARHDLLSKIQRMDKVLNPATEAEFLTDLAEKRLGIEVTYEEAQTINDLANKASDLEARLKAGNLPDRLEYGRAQVALNNYVNKLKLATNKVTWAEIKHRPDKMVLKGANEIAGNAKAINASMDNSAVFHQGWRPLWTNPIIWQRNARQSFVNLFKLFGQDAVMDELNADIISRPTYDLMKKAKLDVGINEEVFPTTLPEKIPGFGRLYKASENAYTAFVRKTRADIFDKVIKIAENSGVDLTKAEEVEPIGKLVNSLTGRGSLGAFERAGKVINNILFAPKYVKSQFDTFGGHIITGAGGSNFVRKQAALNLVKILLGTSAVLAIARFLKPDSVELDPRSADFGKIKIRNTRFDVTAGAGSLATLAARLLTMSSKSSATDEVKTLNQKNKSGTPLYGTTTGADLVETFAENKAAPIGQLAIDLLTGMTRQGETPTFLNEAENLFTPLSYKTGKELWKDPNAADFTSSMILDALGIATNTYGGSKDIQTQINDAKSRGDVKEVERLQKALKETLVISAQKKRDYKLQNPPAPLPTADDLKQQLDSGKITKEKYDAQINNLKLSDVQREAKNLDASDDNDFNSIEQFLQTVPPTEKNNVRIILEKKMYNKDNSVKGQNDAQRLGELIDTYLETPETREIKKQLKEARKTQDWTKAAELNEKLTKLRKSGQ
jgi:hypothetical protein